MSTTTPTTHTTTAAKAAASKQILARGPQRLTHSAITPFQSSYLNPPH
eukprot:CAMPEP_0119469036 /NCGR_PEP_ID=MMETSP1344-20130328/2538_1 /TAXON_ID=236787 /ORGANISM="Florenciella parvula, Strain CCMP2471" /LENGTH=47 /DNA_ID= /DNA_START= /DNA_END= /DNA_ORIENTATION=